MESRYWKPLLTLALVALAYVIARLGRFLLDWVLSIEPAWAAVGERGGGWLIGLIVVVVVVLPMFKLYGLLDRNRNGKGH